MPLTPSVDRALASEATFADSNSDGRSTYSERWFVFPKANNGDYENRFGEGTHVPNGHITVVNVSMTFARFGKRQGRWNLAFSFANNLL
jgi:hypothetical protein